jgi:hypothetical protein
MRLYKAALLIIFQSSFLMAEDSLELKEYKIEIIIFQHMNPSTDEVFQNDFTPPTGKVLNFYKPNLKINKKSFEVKAEENFFTNLFKNIKPSNFRTKFIGTNELNTGVANPKSWYRKDDNLITLARLNNKLSRNNNYKVLDSFSWIQNIEGKDKSSYLYHEEFKKKYGFFLKFYRSRFLHTDLKAYLGVLGLSGTNITESYIRKYDKKLLEVSANKSLKKNIEIKLNSKNDFVDINADDESQIDKVSKSKNINWFIDEDKRIFNNEIHYFDHPYFGIVLSVNEI